MRSLFGDIVFITRSSEDHRNLYFYIQKNDNGYIVSVTFKDVENTGYNMYALQKKLSIMQWMPLCPYSKDDILSGYEDFEYISVFEDIQTILLSFCSAIMGGKVNRVDSISIDKSLWLSDIQTKMLKQMEYGSFLLMKSENSLLNKGVLLLKGSQTIYLNDISVSEIIKEDHKVSDYLVGSSYCIVISGTKSEKLIKFFVNKDSGVLYYLGSDFNKK